MLIKSLWIGAASFWLSSAQAQDDWLDDEEETSSKRDDSGPDDLDDDLTEEELKKLQEASGASKGEGLDLEDEDDVSLQLDGQDNAEIYSQFKADLERLGPDEEMIEWANYLKEYPNTIFKDQIVRRQAELDDALYGERIEDRFQEEKTAGQAEILLTQPISLSNIDPRRKFHAGFEMGFPRFFNLILDYEHQLRRDLSVHAGAQNSLLGFTPEFGVKYAFIKSARTQMLTTGCFDVLLGTSIGVRPTVGWGQRFELPKAMQLDVMAQVGSDVVFTPIFDPRLNAGFQVALIPNHTVRIFAESKLYMKDFAWQGSPFAFNYVTIGLKFFDRKPSKDDRFEAGFGTSIPVYYKYWQQHIGAIAGDVNVYF